MFSYQYVLHLTSCNTLYCTYYTSTSPSSCIQDRIRSETATWSTEQERCCKERLRTLWRAGRRHDACDLCMCSF
jgi:hypothetical protein